MCLGVCFRALPEASTWGRRVKRRRAEVARLWAGDQEEEEEGQALVWMATIPLHIFSSGGQQVFYGLTCPSHIERREGEDRDYYQHPARIT